MERKIMGLSLLAVLIIAVFGIILMFADGDDFIEYNEDERIKEAES